MIVLVTAEKDGMGKSTIASNIVACLVRQNADAVLIDIDGQAICARFSERRDEASIGPAMPCIQRTGGVTAALYDLSRCYQVTVVDAGDHDFHEMRLTVAVPNLLLVSTRANQVDLEALPRVSELASLVRGLSPDLKAFVVLSMAPSNPTIRKVDDAREVLNQLDQLEPVDTIIRDRKVYRDALPNGNGVAGLNNSQACAEIQLLIQRFSEVATWAWVSK